MSEEGMSLDSDEAKRNARKNILQALGSSHTLSPTSPTQSHHSKDEIAGKESSGGLAKDLQLEVRSHHSFQPPAPKPRSPRHSPTNR